MAKHKEALHEKNISMTLGEVVMDDSSRTSTVVALSQ